MNIGLIGAGNMGKSLIQGWIKHKIQPNSIFLSEINTDINEKLKSEFDIQITSLEKLCKECDVIVLAVKPFRITETCQYIAEHAQNQNKKPLILSIAAGVRVKVLLQYLGTDFSVIRVMPNLAAQVQKSMSVLFADKKVHQSDRLLAEKVIQSVGHCFWIQDENMMNVVTAISGSGPAYFLLMTEMMIAAAIDKGLTPAQAKTLVIKTFTGTEKLLSFYDSPAKLRDCVTSKGGTTEKAIEVFLSGHFEKLCNEAIDSAYKRSIEIEKEIM